jgi:hypothetical protein
MIYSVHLKAWGKIAIFTIDGNTSKQKWTSPPPFEAISLVLLDDVYTSQAVRLSRSRRRRNTHVLALRDNLRRKRKVGVTFFSTNKTLLLVSRAHASVSFGFEQTRRRAKPMLSPIIRRKPRDRIMEHIYERKPLRQYYEITTTETNDARVIRDRRAKHEFQ